METEGHRRGRGQRATQAAGRPMLDAKRRSCSEALNHPAVVQARSSGPEGRDRRRSARSAAKAPEAALKLAPPPIERLVAQLKRLPGIGEKSATRLAFHLLSAPETQVAELADAIGRVKREIVLCDVCFDLTEASPCEYLQGREARCGRDLCRRGAGRSASIERTGGSARPLSRAGWRDRPDRRHRAATSCASANCSSASRVRAGDRARGGARDQPQRRGGRHRPLHRRAPTPARGARHPHRLRHAARRRPRIRRPRHRKSAP